MPLSALLNTRRVVLCVGSGGVGKTTTTAALGLAAAKQGKRVLCLTIDPARRLAQSLGLERVTADAQVVSPTRFDDAGLKVPGSLTVMMLDTKRTFDQIVARHASSPEARDRILNNKLYHYVSTALAGTQEYMAMEKLHEVKNNPNFDLIILDTPPTANALDFLDAPARLIEALDSPATRWFVQAFQSTRKLSLNLLAKSAAIALRGVGKLTGGRFLEDVAEFLTELNDLFGGFRTRASEVQRALRGPEVAYVLVTSPSPMAIREVIYFSERLTSLGMSTDAFVVNRVHISPSSKASPDDIAKAAKRHNLVLDDDAAERIAVALSDERKQADVDSRNLRQLDRLLNHASTKAARACVEAFPYDVHDLPSLDQVSRRLVGDALVAAEAPAICCDAH